MQEMPRPRLPHLHRERSRHGALVWYVRVGHGPRIRLRAAFGTPEFADEYKAAINGDKPSPKNRARAGSLAWLVDRYRDSSAWLTLSIATRRQRENILERVLATAGTEPFSHIDRKTIIAGRERRKDTPAAARHFIETMRGLFRWAVDAEIAASDPTRDVAAPKKATDGHHVWTEDEIAKFEAHWPIGTRERLAFDVLLYTGLRRGDAVRLGRQHVKDGLIRIKTEKTGETVTHPMLAPLVESIKASPTGDLTYIAGQRGLPMTKEAFGNWFRSVCNDADVPGSAHGLRKAAATRFANAGATVAQLEAWFGWQGGGMASLYTRTADRERLAKDAAAKMLSAQDSNIYSRTIECGEGNAQNVKGKSNAQESNGGRGRYPTSALDQ